MYIEDLSYPHPQRSEAENTTASTVLQELETIAAQPMRQADAANAASRILRRALLWPGEQPNMEFDGSVPFESLKNSQVSTCSGYTAALSESLDFLGVEHYVGFANRHAFTLVADKQDNKPGLWFIDAMTPSLNQRLEPGSITGRYDTLVAQIATHGRGAYLLNSLHLTQNTGRNVEDMAMRSFWLLNCPNSTSAAFQLSSLRGDAWNRRLNHYTRLIGTMYPPAIGRAVLRNNADFQAATTQSHDDEAALTSLEPLAGKVPDIDLTHNHQGIKWLVRSLAQKRRVDDAVAATDMYVRGFDITKDPREHLLRGDLLRSIYVAAKDKASESIALEALKHYRLGHQKSKTAHATTLGKVRKMESILIASDTPVDARA